MKMTPDDILRQARKRMGEAVDADEHNREEALDDLEHLAGKHWPDEIKRERETANRPVITINQLPQFARQVTGDIRRLNPAIKITPADNEATKDGAEVLSGIVRHIEYRSDASTVYEGAAESAAQCGMGAFRVLTEYESPVSFNQEIRIERINNPFAVYWDPSARTPTREDARYCFITDRMTIEDFEAQYPGKARADADHDESNDILHHWTEEGEVVIAEYFWKKTRKKKIGMLASGVVIENPVAANDLVAVREVDDDVICWAKINGAEVLEGPVEMPWRHIPVVAVIGEEMNVGDRVVRTSVIRFAKDPARLYNFWTSAGAEVGALQPKAPYMVTVNQVRGLESIWATANDTNRAYLPYVPDEKAPPPQRMPPPVASSAIFQEIAKAADDMRATTGIYDAALGGRSNETSGVAIRQRQMESDISTSIYSDNLAKSIAHCGRILVDMIPKVYDTNRFVRTIGDDDQEKMVEVNGMTFDPQTGAVPVNPLNIGRYDVRVSVGPNYSTRRQETQEGMMQFIQAFPAAATVAGDLIAKSMDWPDADKLADRLKKMLPPGMIDPEDMTPEEQQAMQQQQAMQAQAMQMEQAKQQAEIRKTLAGATEDEADAVKAQAEAAKTQMEMAMQSGQIDAAFQQAVQQAVQQALLQVLGR
jgi:hypothetical protein